MTQQLNWNQETYKKAYRFAAEAHQGQKMPGTDLPYLMHLSFVTMEMIAALTLEPDRAGNLAIQCALLHDVIEDTERTFDDVESAFGGLVAKGVLALTKNASLEKSLQMADSLNRIRQQPREVWMVKLADRITNLARPPHYWKTEKMKIYRDEAVEIHTALHEANVDLGQRLLEKIEVYEQYF